MQEEWLLGSVFGCTQRGPLNMRWRRPQFQRSREQIWAMWFCCSRVLVRVRLLTAMADFKLVECAMGTKIYKQTKKSYLCKNVIARDSVWPNNKHLFKLQ